MQANASSNDFLDILEKLPDADRLRILEILPKENAVAALQAALRERSRLREPEQHQDQGHQPQSRLREPERNQVQEQPSQPVAEPEGDVTADAEIQLVDLDTYIRFRNEDGGAVPRDVHDLPQPVQTALEDRFKAMWDCKEGRVKEYGRITSKPELYTDKEYCIRNLIIRGSRVRGTMFGHGGKHKKSACDKCINSGHPCAHVIKVNDEFGKLFVPLPRALRKGQNWDELGYWVVEK